MVLCFQITTILMMTLLVLMGLMALTIICHPPLVCIFLPCKTLTLPQPNSCTGGAEITTSAATLEERRMTDFKKKNDMAELTRMMTTILKVPL